MSHLQRSSEAANTATTLIQGYIGPDHKVMTPIHSALAQALRQARNVASSTAPTMR